VIQKNLVTNKFISTIYGSKPLIYADYTASGRFLNVIEDYIWKSIEPYYANTHTDASFTGMYISQIREDSRTQIKKICGANKLDSLIFVGSGSTGAVNLLIHKLGLKMGCSKMMSDAK